MLSDAKVGNGDTHTTGSDQRLEIYGKWVEGITYHDYEFGHDNNDTQMMIMKEIHHSSFDQVFFLI